MNKYFATDEHIPYPEGLTTHVELCSLRNSLPHFHKTSLELVYCLRGQVYLVTGEQQVLLKEGYIFSVDANEIHYMSNPADEDNLLLIFHMDLTAHEGCFFDGEPVMFTCESTHIYPYQYEAMNHVKDIILALAAASFGGYLDYECRTAEDNLADTLCRYFDWYNYNNQDEYINPDLHDRFYSSFSYCMRHYRNKITASELASREHVNPNYFSQFLTTTVFKSFSSMVKYVRCFRAHHLLLETDLPNYEIAYSVGFSDPKYFYAAYNDWWGCSPKKTRSSADAHILRCLTSEKSIEVIDDTNALETIERYISQWHMRKILFP